jgi:hypothetical protein
MLPDGRSTHQLNLGGIEPRKEMGVGHDTGRRKFLHLLGLAPIAPIAFPRNGELVAKGEQISQGSRQNVEEINRAILAALKRNPAKGVYSVPGVWYDIRDYGDVSSGTITTAMQATIDHIVNTSSKCRTIMIPAIEGVTSPSLGTVTFTGSNWRIIVASRQLSLSTTFTVPSSSKIEGWSFQGGGNPNQWTTGVTLNCSGNPGVLMSGLFNSEIEGINISAPHVGLKITECSTCTMSRCVFTSTGGSGTDYPLELHNSFWINFRDCMFDTVGATYCGVFLQDLDVGQATGLINCKNIILENVGFFIQSTLVNAANCGNFYFEDLYSENFHADSALVTIDSSHGFLIENIILIRPGAADAVGTAYVINNIGTRTHAVRIHDVYGAATREINPTSDQIIGFEWDSDGSQPTTHGHTPTYFQDWSREWSTAIDKILLSSPRGPQFVLGTAENVTQDPASWSGGTITTGILGPDGSTKAGQIGGSFQVGPTVYSSSKTLAVGDWFIAGCWVQMPVATQTIPGNFAQMDFSTWGTSSTNARINGSTVGNGFDIGFGSHFYLKDGAWAWTCEAFKVTALGTGNCTVKMTLKRGVENAVNFFGPCVQYIQASAGFSDYDIINAARAYRGSWGSGALASDFTILPHQQFRGQLKLPALTFATLPSSPVAGMQRYITDSNTDKWGATAAGSGSNKVMVWYNGTHWTVVGK